MFVLARSASWPTAMVCCVTGPRRFPPSNHAKDFEYFLRARAGSRPAGSAVAAVTSKRRYGAPKAESLPRNVGATTEPQGSASSALRRPGGTRPASFRCSAPTRSRGNSTPLSQARCLPHVFVWRLVHWDLLDESPCWDWIALRLLRRAFARKTMQSENHSTDCAMWVRLWSSNAATSAHAPARAKRMAGMWRSVTLALGLSGMVCVNENWPPAPNWFVTRLCQFPGI